MIFMGRRAGRPTLEFSEEVVTAMRSNTNKVKPATDGAEYVCA
jgi:hypothetical protein